LEIRALSKARPAQSRPLRTANPSSSRTIACGARFISTTRPLSSLMMIPEHNRSSACSANEDRHLKLRAATHVTKPGCCNPALLLFEIAGTVSSLLVLVNKSTIFPPKSIIAQVPEQRLSSSVYWSAAKSDNGLGFRCRPINGGPFMRRQPKSESLPDIQGKIFGDRACRETTGCRPRWSLRHRTSVCLPRLERRRSRVPSCSKTVFGAYDATF
jgi:hypothetical protein